MTINTISPNEKDQVKINEVIRRLIEIENSGGSGSGGGSGGGDGVGSGRLTLQTLTPVMTTTQSAKTTIYYTPYRGTSISIYDGADFATTTFTELSAATSDTTKSPAAIGASKVNDWFVWLDGSTVTLSHGPDWTSDTVRSAGTALVMVNGILLNDASITNGPAASRGTYVGTTRSNGSSQIDWIYGAVAANGTAGFFGVWNAYNRVSVASSVGDTTDSWTYTGVVRAANGSSTMRNSFVMGLQEDYVISEYGSLCTPPTSTNNAMVGVGVDLTTAFSGSKGFFGLLGGSVLQKGAVQNTYLGFHFHSACEATDTGASNAIFYGDNGNGALYQSMMITQMRM